MTTRRDQRKTDAPRAFTLIELIAVITITAILAALALPALTNISNARTAGAANALAQHLSYAREHAISTASRIVVIEHDAGEQIKPVYTINESDR